MAITKTAKGGIGLAIIATAGYGFQFGKEAIAGYRETISMMHEKIVVMNDKMRRDSTENAGYQIWNNNKIDSMECAGDKLSKSLNVNLKNCH